MRVRSTQRKGLQTTRWGAQTTPMAKCTMLSTFSRARASRSQILRKANPKAPSATFSGPKRPLDCTHRRTKPARAAKAQRAFCRPDESYFSPTSGRKQHLDTKKTTNNPKQATRRVRPSHANAPTRLPSLLRYASMASSLATGPLYLMSKGAPGNKQSGIHPPPPSEHLHAPGGVGGTASPASALPPPLPSIGRTAMNFLTISSVTAALASW